MLTGGSIHVAIKCGSDASKLDSRTPMECPEPVLSSGRFRKLDAATDRPPLPATIRIDQGTEFVSRDLDLWAYQRGVTLDFSRPGKPTDTTFIEGFDSRFRAECLNAHWFMSFCGRPETIGKLAQVLQQRRPHGVIGQKPPITLLTHDGAASRQSDRGGTLYRPAIQSSVSLPFVHGKTMDASNKPHSN